MHTAKEALDPTLEKWDDRLRVMGRLCCRSGSESPPGFRQSRIRVRTSLRPSTSAAKRRVVLETFTFFRKHRLSQWHHAPFVIGGVTFTHAEQYMMYAKALLFGDRDSADDILATELPRDQQAIGRAVTGFDEDADSRS